MAVADAKGRSAGAPKCSAPIAREDADAMPRRPAVVIQPLGFAAPVMKAAAELAHYLPQLAPVKAVARAPRAVVPEGSAPAIVLGLPEDLKGFGLGALPAPRPLDDAIALVPKGSVLYLTGSNPRSVLFAAYRLLEELGAVFLRPGPDGEVLPKRDGLALPARPIREEASYRHRGVSIQGSPRLEHVLDLLDWMAKKKMNSFQLMFRHSGVFWRDGYTSPEMDAASRAVRLSDADCLALDDQVIARVKELGMVLHRVGHGWTTAAAGYAGYDWETMTELPQGVRRPWLAEVNGKRELFHGQPINTELCYSNPEVRAALVEEAAVYARQHSEVDVLCVWMSDTRNNKCECAGCRKKTPSDWYALVIDEIAARLKAERLPTRVNFLAYQDLLWPPIGKAFAADNVVFMYAPIWRCFRHPLADPRCGQEEALTADRPALNRCQLPSTNRVYAEVARQWQPLGLGDSFLFDYHLWWVLFEDGMGQDIGAVMAQDVKDLRDFGLNGLISCQAMRAFYPLPYLPNVMADMLWDRARATGSHRKAIVGAAFGPHAEEVGGYFIGLVRLFQTAGGYHHRTVLQERSAAARATLSEIVTVAADARRRFRALAASEKGVVRRSLQLLAIHADHVRIIAAARLAGLAGKAGEVESLRRAYEKRLPALLRRFHPWIDPLIAEPVRRACREAAALAAGGPLLAREQPEV
jgi:hypothetical protein